MSQVFKRLLSYVGKVKLEQLPKEWQKPVDDALKAVEKADPNVKKAEIKYISLPKKEIIYLLTLTPRGAKPHKSHTDPSDTLDVISVRLLKQSGSRVDSIHIHQDSTSKRK